MPVVARDLMLTDLVTLSPELPLVDAHRALIESGVSGAPVVDDGNSIVGVLSSSDLLRSVAEEHDSDIVRVDYFREVLDFSGPEGASDLDDFQDRLKELTVADVMTRELVTITPNASLRDVAATLARHRIHRVLVVEGDRLAGIISTFDFVELFV